MDYDLDYDLHHPENLYAADSPLINIPKKSEPRELYVFRGSRVVSLTSFIIVRVCYTAEHNPQLGVARF